MFSQQTPGDSELGEFVWASPGVSESVSGQRNHLFLKDHSGFQPTDLGSCPGSSPEPLEHHQILWYGSENHCHGDLGSRLEQ